MNENQGRLRAAFTLYKFEELKPVAQARALSETEQLLGNAEALFLNDKAWEFLQEAFPSLEVVSAGTPRAKEAGSDSIVYGWSGFSEQGSGLSFVGHISKEAVPSLPWKDADELILVRRNYRYSHENTVSIEIDTDTVDPSQEEEALLATLREIMKVAYRYVENCYWEEWQLRIKEEAQKKWFTVTGEVPNHGWSEA